jgi:ribosome-associated protein
VVGLVNSGGEANTFIANGEVRVNDEVETRKRNKIKAGFKVEFDEQVLLIK